MAHDTLVGVFDWDMSGPSTPLVDLGFLAWNAVPLWRDVGPLTAARRLGLIASTYGGPAPTVILHATVLRTEHRIAGIERGQAAADPGMLNLVDVGEPHRTRTALADLRSRIPAIEKELT